MKSNIPPFLIAFYAKIGDRNFILSIATNQLSSKNFSWFDPQISQVTHYNKCAVEIEKSDGFYFSLLATEKIMVPNLWK